MRWTAEGPAENVQTIWTAAGPVEQMPEDPRDKELEKLKERMQKEQDEAFCQGFDEDYKGCTSDDRCEWLQSYRACAPLHISK